MGNRPNSLIAITILAIITFSQCYARPNQRTKAAPTCGYDSCAKTDDNLINVHLVAHTHDDVGWLKTVDQYYYGSRSNIQKAGVQYILDSVVASLLEDPAKKFIYVESAFFFKWWREQTPEKQQSVKMLVAEGRLEFIGGAWSMNDEATTIYQSTIDQFTWGLRRLNDTFGECGRPKVGWQIDPFGHSREMASMFAQMSFDGYFFGRLHYADKNRRLASKEMEMVWKASDNLGEDAEIFTGALYNTYSPPPGFCWDILCSDEPFIDNKHSKDYNVDRLLTNFMAFLEKQVEAFRTNHIVLTMGGDFTYQNANVYYRNLDKLIRYGNKRKAQGSQFNFIYSTPSCYLKSLHEANKTWPTYTQDFFPYASDQTAVWTGYFTSRPTVKRYERVGNHFLQVCKQLTALAFLKNFAKRIDSSHHGKTLTAHLTFLREQMGVMQHHDAVTGTEKQHVADDYTRSLYIALKACNYNAMIILNEMTRPSTDDETTAPPPVTSEKLSLKKWAEDPHDHITVPNMQFEFQSCHLLNISRCAISESNGRFMVTVYNPLAHSTFQAVRIPVPHVNYRVRDYRKVPVQIQMVPVTDRTKNIPGPTGQSAAFEIVFLAQEVPPLGYKSYYVDVSKEDEEEPQHASNDNEPIVILLQNDANGQSDGWEAPTESEVSIGNQNIQAKFNAETGLLSSIVVDGEAHNLTQDFFYYNAAAGGNYHPDERASGAYIFRPNGTEVRRKEKVILKVMRGEVVDEVYQKFNDWISQIVRIYHDNSSASGIEFAWTVGPIPIGDHLGKEIVSRFRSQIGNRGIFYTDSNGREMLQRKRNNEPLWREELVAINYYPVNSKIYIEDAASRMAVLTDRSQGATSLEDGDIDVLVHRRLLADDAFGVGEALNETQFGQGLVATGTLNLLFNSWKEDASPGAGAKERFMQNRMLLSNWLFFSTINDTYEDWQSKYRNIATHLTLALPQNVYLMTMEPWRDSEYLVRFEHLLERDEDKNYSKPVTFTMQDVFGTLFDIEWVRETNLAANQWLSDVKRLKFRIKEGAAEADNAAVYPERAMNTGDDDADHTVTLAPMQIRTFIIGVTEQL